MMMGSEGIPLPGRLIMGVLWVHEEELEKAENRLTGMFGPVEFKSGNVPFRRYTLYYEREMGKNIQRCFWVYKEPIERGALVEAKLATNRLERDLARSGRRTINLDPGLLTLETVCLATTKPYYHRIYIAKGIYGELTLFYRRGGFETLPWTYPDYSDKRTRDFFLMVREEMLEKRRGQEATV